MKTLTWFALLVAGAGTALANDPDGSERVQPPVVDIAALEVVAASPADEASLGEPLRRVAEELDRALEDSRGPAWHAPELPAADYLAAAR